MKKEASIKADTEAASKNASKHRSGIKITVASTIVVLANLIFFFMLWVIDHYKNVQFDQILFQAKAPIEGTSGGIVLDALLRTVTLGLLAAAIAITVL